MPNLWDPLEDLNPAQQVQIRQYFELLKHYNQRINLISREASIAQIENHVRHALALMLKSFPSESILVDWGTGGGIPAIPLAIALPEVTIYAVDAVRKKVQAVHTMAKRLGLSNIFAWHGRAEVWPGQSHYSVSRATAPLVDLWRWHERVALTHSVIPEAWRPGLLCLKGGDLKTEMAALYSEYPGLKAEEISLQPLLEGSFEDKVIVAIYELDER